MANFLLHFLITVVLLASYGAAFANGNLEISMTGGYSGNLLSDSSDQDDSFAMTSVSLKIHPLSLAQIGVNAGYTYY